MKFKLTSPFVYPERILLYGGGGVGKSTAIMRVAEAIPTAQVFVVESDISFSFDRMLPSYPTVDNLDVHIVMPGWSEFIDTVKEIVSKHNPLADVPIHERAWLAIDSVTPSWEDCQAEYVDRVMGEEISDAMMKLKRDSKNQREYMGSLSELLNWPVVNKMYAQLYRELMRWRGSFILTAEVAEVGGRDKPEISNVFGYLGCKPKGQGRLHHVASTNLLLACRNKDTFVMTAAKDRERDKVDGMVFNNWAVDYLADVAGWDRVPR